MSGPLAGLRVLEFAGLGPGPFAAMMLADMGADVVCVAAPGRVPDAGSPISRGRRVVVLDLKESGGAAGAAGLAGRAEVLIEGFRPGVMERLGLGPEVLLPANPGLVYGRMTGWGQEGVLARAAGHDINYIGLAGALAAIGPGAGPPCPPLNLVGDYGGGALYLVAGVLAAVLHARATGEGQVVDCAMVDGVTSLLSMFIHARQEGRWGEGREANLLDGGAPFYRAYECADGRHVAVGAIEPQFYAALLRVLGLGAGFEPQHDRAAWPARRAALAALFLTRGRDDWCAMFDGVDACVSPVLAMSEVGGHPHMAGRGVLVEAAGGQVPAPAPRFGRTPSCAGAGPVGVEDVWGVWRGIGGQGRG